VRHDFFEKYLGFGVPSAAFNDFLKNMARVRLDAHLSSFANQFLQDERNIFCVRFFKTFLNYVASILIVNTFLDSAFEFLSNFNDVAVRNSVNDLLENST